MPAPRRYPPELRERARRMVVEARLEDPGLSLHQAVLRIGPRVGVNSDTLRGWFRQGQIDAGELKRANEILLAASSFFARELDPRLPW